MHYIPFLSEHLPLAAVTLSGLAAGFINVLAGGGSLIALPMLNFAGLDLGVANATNRVSILIQNGSAMAFYQKRRAIDWRTVLIYSAPAVVGAVAGTMSAVSIPPKAFQLIAALSIAVMGVMLALKPAMWENPTGKPLGPVARSIVLALVGVYGGFLQAGVGFFLIWAIAGGCKKDLRETNIIKIVVVAIYTAASLAIFTSFGLVNWRAAIALSIGSSIGARLGANFNIKGKKKWIRYLLMTAVFISAAKIIFDTLS